MGIDTYLKDFTNDVIVNSSVIEQQTGEPMALYSIDITITNPGAETGDTTGWTSETGSLGVRDFNPDPHASGGSYFFDGGSVTLTEASQEIDLDAQGVSTTDIDNEVLVFTFTAIQASYNVKDQGQLEIRFKNAARSTIETHTTVKHATSPALTWEEVGINRVTIPENTRYVDLVMRMDRKDGSVNNAYFDLLAAKVEKLDSGSTSITITNPGAETGDTTGWTSETGTLDVNTINPSAYAGSYYFDGGTSSEVVASQEIDLDDQGVSTTDIDNEILAFTFAGYQSSYNVSDKAQLQIRFKNAARATIETHSTLLHATTPGETWEAVSLNRISIPENTRYIDLVMRMVKTDGTRNNGNFDALTAVVEKLYVESTTSIPIMIHHYKMAGGL